MPSTYTIRTSGNNTSYELDDRYGSLRTGFADLPLVYDMMRLDDRIEEAGIACGDSFEVLMEKWVPSPEHQCMLLGLYWIPVQDAVFLEIDNGRIRVSDTRHGHEGERYAAFDSNLDQILDFRKLV